MIVLASFVFILVISSIIVTISRPKPTIQKGSNITDNTSQTNGQTQTNQEGQNSAGSSGESSDATDVYGGTSNPYTDPDFSTDPSIITLPVFGTSIVFSTHQSIYNEAKITVKPNTVASRKQIIITGKGCNTWTFYAYENSDGYYSIDEWRSLQGTPYVFQPGPPPVPVKICDIEPGKPDKNAIDAGFKDEALYIFRSFR